MSMSVDAFAINPSHTRVYGAWVLLTQYSSPINLSTSLVAFSCCTQAILEFVELGYCICKITQYSSPPQLEFKKLKYQPAFFNSQNPTQLVPRWNARQELEFLKLEYQKSSTLLFSSKTVLDCHKFCQYVNGCSVLRMAFKKKNQFFFFFWLNKKIICVLQSYDIFNEPCDLLK